MTKQELAKAKLDAETDGLTVRQYIYIGELESAVSQLTADNASLIEQVNACGVKYEKLLSIASETLAELSKDCPRFAKDYQCEHFDECDPINAENFPCWRKWLEGVKDAK